MQTISCRVRLSFSWDGVLHCRFACLCGEWKGDGHRLIFFFTGNFRAFPNWQYVLNAPFFASRRQAGVMTLGPLFDPSLPPSNQRLLPIARPFAFVRSSIFTQNHRKKKTRIRGQVKTQSLASHDYQLRVITLPPRPSLRPAPLGAFKSQPWSQPGRIQVV